MRQEKIIMRMSDAEAEYEKNKACRRTCILVTYKQTSDRTSEPVSRGTGFFLNIGGSHFICTCAHVLKKFCALRNEHVGTFVQAAIKDGTTGLEQYDGYYIKSLDLDDMCHPVDKKNHIDVALLRLKPADVEAVKASKEFITYKQIDVTLPAQKGMFHYRGYPEANVEPDISKGQYDEAEQEIKALGRTHFLRVKEADGNLIVLDRVDDTVILDGISGSALFDSKSCLRGIVWGVYGNLVYATPVQHILDLANWCMSNGNG